MPAITFFSLLLEANKQENYRRKWSLTASAYPQMTQDGRDELRNMMQLPDDILRDMMPIESSTSEKEAFKRTLNGE